MYGYLSTARFPSFFSIFLAEAAQLLSQSVTYELPGLRRQLQKAVASQEECDKKEKDNDRKAAEFRREFERSCEQLGIQGERRCLRREIIDLMKDLPETYTDLAERSKGLKAARDGYCAFLARTLDEGVMSPEQDALPALKFLMERGNVTTYEWMHGEPPLSVEEPQIDFGEEDDKEEEEKEGDDNIDFGDDDDGGAAGGIDFGDDVELDSGTDIDWGNLDAAGDDEAGEIDWGAATGDDDAAAIGITVEDGGVSGGVARDSEALSMLDNRRTRTVLLDELSELECFLEQRLVELQAADDGVFSVGGGDALGSENADALRAHVALIRDLTKVLTAGKIHHLQLIRSSPKYVDRMVEGLKSKLALVERMRLGNLALAERRDQAIKDQAEFQRKFDLVKEKTRELQKDIEGDISKRYKGRPVNIMGGVQSL